MLQLLNLIAVMANVVTSCEHTPKLRQNSAQKRTVRLFCIYPIAQRSVSFDAEKPRSELKLGVMRIFPRMSVSVISVIRLKTRYMYCLDCSAYTEIKANLLSLSREKVPGFDNYSNMNKLNCHSFSSVFGSSISQNLF